MATCGPAWRSVALAAALLAALVHLSAVGNAFVYDDLVLIVANPRVHGAGGLVSCFTTPYWGEAAAGLYRPLPLATYALNFVLGGLDPRGYVLVNVALHALVTALVAHAVRSLGGGPRLGAAAALLFAVHPVHTEAVAGIVGRAELLCAAFFLAAVLVHRRLPRLRAAARPTAAWWGAGAGAALLALLSKEHAVLLLPLLVALDLLVPPAGRRRAGDYLAPLGALLVYLPLRVAVLGRYAWGAARPPVLDNPLAAAGSAAERLRGALAVLPEDARLLLFPARLSADYSHDLLPLPGSWWDGRALLGVGLVLAVALGVWLLRRRAPLAAAGLAWLAITFALASNLVVLTGTILAERLLYLPSVGLVLALGVPWVRLASGRGPGRVVAIAALALLVGLGAGRSAARSRDWRDSLTLWQTAVRAAPGSARAHGQLGLFLRAAAEEALRAGQIEQAVALLGRAEEHLGRALELHAAYPVVSEHLGDVYVMQGRLEAALPRYEAAVRLGGGSEPHAKWRRALEARAAQLERRLRASPPPPDAAALRAEVERARALARALEEGSWRP